jgi:DNA repair protein RadA/Sms
MPLAGQDVYVNIVGGLRVVEPAADLAVAAAVASSFREIRVDPRAALIGEVGLSGEARTVSQIERRLREAARLGFKRAIVPSAFVPGRLATELGIELNRVGTVSEAIDAALNGR